jgi:hypothetical protein
MISKSAPWPLEASPAALTVLHDDSLSAARTYRYLTAKSGHLPAEMNDLGTGSRPVLATAKETPHVELEWLGGLEYRRLEVYRRHRSLDRIILAWMHCQGVPELLKLLYQLQMLLYELLV